MEGSRRLLLVRGPSKARQIIWRDKVEDFLVPIAFFAMIAAIVVLPRYFKSQERQKLADTMRAAIEKGQPLSPELMDVLTKNEPLPRQPAPRSDMRTGVIWLSVAAGLCALGLIMSYAEPDHTLHVFAFAALPACIGAAYLILAQLNKPKS
jgi:hypothetical protein